MKKLLQTLTAVLLVVVSLFSFAACNNNSGNNPPVTPPEESEINIDNEFTATSDVLVVYFSKTNTTESVALKIRELTNADIFEVERKEPYPDDYTSTTEIAKAEKEANARPELKTYLPKDVVNSYDTIIVGFPIWWHTAPMAIFSFLNFYDLSGKTIYTFCTSGGSPISESTDDIRNNAKGATVVEGQKFTRNDSNIESWVNSLGLGQKPSEETPDNSDNSENETPNVPETPNNPNVPDDSEDTDILIVYFSWSSSGRTEQIANRIGNQTGGNVSEIVPLIPYPTTSYTVWGEQARDERDNNARPAIRDPLTQAQIDEYDVIFVGYPIWWHTAPMIIGTFLESYDLVGKDIYPFSQSDSMNVEQFNNSMSFVRGCAEGANVHDGMFVRASNTSGIDNYLRTNGFIS